MVRYYFKKYNAIVCGIFLTCSAQGMDKKLIDNQMISIGQNMLYTLERITPPAVYALTLLSQLPIVNAYEPGTKAFCYAACAQNCSVTIDPMCDLSYNNVILPIILTVTSLFTFGTCCGCIMQCCKKDDTAANS